MASQRGRCFVVLKLQFKEIHRVPVNTIFLINRITFASDSYLHKVLSLFNLKVESVCGLVPEMVHVELLFQN